MYMYMYDTVVETRGIGYEHSRISRLLGASCTCTYVYMCMILDLSSGRVESFHLTKFCSSQSSFFSIWEGLVHKIICHHGQLLPRKKVGEEGVLE